MTSSWLPTWVAAGWTVALLVVAVVHLRHAAVMPGRARWWHAAHVLMALGMVEMYWPSRSRPVGSAAGAATFALLGAIVVSVIVVDLRRRVRQARLLALTALATLSMSYMFLMTSYRLEWLSVLVAGWFSLETLGWLGGALAATDRHAGLRGAPSSPGRVPVLERVGAVAGSPMQWTKTQVDLDRAAAAPARNSQGPDPLRGLPLRLTLAVMSAAMGYMVVAMQFGMSMASTMPSMPSMPSMHGM